MNVTVIPSLGDGWVEDPVRKINLMFANALVSDYSQTTIYAGKVTSIPYIVATYQTNQATMASELEAALQLYFKNVFSIVDVQVTYDAPIGNKYNLYISINITENQKLFSLAASTAVDKGVLSLVTLELNK